MMTPDSCAHFWRPRRGRASGPEVASRIVSQMIGFGKGPVLLRNGENVQANRQDEAAMNSSTSLRSASRAGATRASANKSSKVLHALCSSSSDEESAQQAHMARGARA